MENIGGVGHSGVLFKVFFQTIDETLLGPRVLRERFPCLEDKRIRKQILTEVRSYGEGLV